MARVPSLDGIRAVAFMLVFGVHAGLGRLVDNGVLRGDFGVTIFFFLSGFIITTLLRSEFEKNGSIELTHFWMRRALRILPPFFVVLVASALLTLVLYPTGILSGPGVAAELLFYSNYWVMSHSPDGGPPGLAVVWSLAVEEHFYLLFPLLYVGLQKWRVSPRNQALLLWGLCMAILAWRCVLAMALNASQARINFATDTRVDSILFGCALAIWNNPALDRPTAATERWMRVLLPAALVMLLASLLYHDPVFTKTWCYSLQGVALSFVFMAAVLYHDALPFRFLNYRPVVYIGVLSYSLYLVHVVLMKAVFRLWPQAHAWQSVPLAFAASLIAAWAIQQAVEKPCARARARLAHQGIEPADGTATAVSEVQPQLPVGEAAQRHS